MEKLIQYIVEKYDPEGLIVYGSYADGSENEGSDFDALALTRRAGAGHDGSVVDGVRLDLFLYPPEHFAGDFDPQEAVQCFDGRIVLDKTGQAVRLQQRVRDFLAAYRPKEPERVAQDLAWCQKMAGRCVRGDAEGFYRWHWLLRDSLEIYCDAKGLYYFGPKKALRTMRQNDPGAFALYSAALKALDPAALNAWVQRLQGMRPQSRPDPLEGKNARGKEPDG